MEQQKISYEVLIGEYDKRLMELQKELLILKAHNLELLHRLSTETEKQEAPK